LQNWFGDAAAMPGRHFQLMPHHLAQQWSDIVRHTDSGVRVVNDANKFAVQMDVTQYRPEEIDVKIINEGDNQGQSTFLVVTGKHEEKQDEHGYVSRSFSRRYSLPTDVDAKQLACSLSDKGALTLQAPRMHAQLEGARAIPITRVAHAPKLLDKPAAELHVKKAKQGDMTNGV